MFKVFYSWQSDLPKKQNRFLIQNSLEKACTQLKSANGVLSESVIDRDTLGLAGSPHISEAIFGKIRDADAFIADVSIINSPTSSDLQQKSLFEGIYENSKNRLCPNPNVLVELGYAMAHLGNEALILIVNTYYGEVEDLPFDLRSLRTMKYRACPDDDLTQIKKELTTDLANAIKTIASVTREDPVDKILYERTKNVVGQAQGLFNELLKASGLFEQTSSENDLIQSFRVLTEASCQEICTKVNPNIDAPLLIGNRNGTWVEYMKHWRGRSKKFTDQILEFSPFLKREHLAILTRIEHSPYFTQLDFLDSKVGNQTLEWISTSLWKYFRLVLELNTYAERQLANRAGQF